MKEREILERLESAGAMIVNGHIVYNSGNHGKAYVNKDAVYADVRLTSDLCREIAQWFGTGEWGCIDVVAAPAVGGVILATWTAHWLCEYAVKRVSMVYAEKYKRADDSGFGVVVEWEEFVFNRGYDKFIPGKNVLVVEDVLTTGGSAKKVVEAVRKLNGKVVGVGVLCNRGGVSAHDLGDVPELFALTNINLDSWTEEECPLCRDGVLINTDVGKGREFLIRKAAESRKTK